MRWELKTLNELCENVITGGTPSTKVPIYYNGEVPWLRTQEVTFSYIYDTEIKITEDGLNNSSAKWVKENSIIVAMYGNSAGRVGINKIPLTTNQACCNLIIDENLADYRFVYYSLLKDYSILKSMAKGAAQNNLNAGQVKGYKISTPPLIVQQKIGSMLSAYDELIDKNLRRINLLEKIAQTFYKEWFLDLRFPGNKSKNIVDGVPEGWKIGKVSDFFNTSSGGTPSRKNADYYTGNIKWLKTQELNDSFILDTEEKITEEAIKESSAKLFPKNTILVAMYGATIGRTGILYEEAATNQACCALMPKDNRVSYLYGFLFIKNKKNHLISLSMGAAQNNINQQMIKDLSILVPSELIMIQFTEIIQPVFNKILNLQLQNIKLKQARDLLLPKLLNGEIKV